MTFRCSVCRNRTPSQKYLGLRALCKSCYSEYRSIFEGFASNKDKKRKEYLTKQSENQCKLEGIDGNV